MTFLHMIVLVLAATVAVIVADLLGHRGVGTWPLAILVIAMMLLAGYLYDPWIAAAALGLGVGTLLVTVTAMVRRVSADRRVVREAKSARVAEAKRRLEN